MTQPDDRNDDDASVLGEGTDITLADAQAGDQTPATSDPDEMDGDRSLGGTGGENAGGAG